jgi:hypothetical protein
MNLEIGTEAVQFPEKECINGIFLTVYIVNLPMMGVSEVGGIISDTMFMKKVSDIRMVIPKV